MTSLWSHFGFCWCYVFNYFSQDEQFVVQYCLTASWPTLSIAEEMLNYVSNRFPCSQVQIAMAKLATFSSMYGPNSFEYVTHLSFQAKHCYCILVNTSNCIICIPVNLFFVRRGVSWIEFLNSNDYLKDILNLLRDGNLSGAQYLWLRHEVKLYYKFIGCLCLSCMISNGIILSIWKASSPSVFKSLLKTYFFDLAFCHLSCVSLLCMLSLHFVLFYIHFKSV